MTWDLRRYLGLTIDDLGVTVTWREAIDLIGELIRETGSHLYAALAGYRFAGSQAEIAAVLHAEAFVNVNRDRDKQPEPLRLPSPLPEGEEDAPVATAEEVAVMREYLEQHSMFPD